MREHKFRGKRVDAEEWVYGFYTQRWTGTRIKHCIISGFQEFEVIPETVGEYTGLPDKNGNEIFEGDKLDGSYINPITKETIVRHYSVVFKNGNFYAELIGKSPYGDTFLYFKNKECQVIGNKFQNPELLKESD